MTKKNLLKIEKKSGYNWIRFPAAIKPQEYLLLKNKFESILTGKKDQIVIDLSDIDFIYSPIISLCLFLWKKIDKSGGTLSMVNASTKCVKQFEEMKICDVIEIYGNEKEFIASNKDKK